MAGHIEIRLNMAIPDNYVFFCPDTGIHLSRMQPVGYVNRLSPSILRGLKANTLVDVQGLVDIKEGKLKEIEVKVEAPKVEEPVAETPAVEEEDKVEEVKEKKSRKK